MRVSTAKRLAAVIGLGGLLTILLATPSSVRAERLPIRTYTSADGLWSSSVYYLMRDSHGLIWLCTRDGLSRFDGYRFVNYRLGTGASYPSFIIETSKGIYFIALNGGGLYRYDPNAATPGAGATQLGSETDDGRVLLNAEMVSELNFSTLFEDRGGLLWAGVAGEGLSRLEDNNGSVSIRKIELELSQEMKRGFFLISAIREGQDGSLWVGTTQGLIRRLPDGRIAHFTIRREGDFDVVQTLLVDRDGRIWIGHNSVYLVNSGLLVLKPERLDGFAGPGGFISRSLKAHPPATRDGRVLLPDVEGEAVDYTSIEGLNITASTESAPALGTQAVFGIYQTSDGRVWIGLRDTLAVFDGQRFQSYTTRHGIVEAGVVPLAEDLDGDLWIASIIGPLKLSVRGLRTYDKADGLSNADIQSLYEGRDGALHVVNSNWFIGRLDDRRFVAVRPNIPLGAVYGWTSNVAFLDLAGEWWFLTNDGLYRFARTNSLAELARRQPAAVYRENNGLKSRHMYCMFEDSGGGLWVSTRVSDAAFNSLARWQRSSETFHTFTEADGLPAGKSASSFAEDRAGNLWFGFYQGGLVRYRAGRFSSFTPEDGLPDGTITALHSDQRGRLWITSSAGGLGRVDDPTAERVHFVSYTTAEGLSTNNARCITEDLDGRIYVGTVRGVDRLTAETGKFNHYSVSDGLAGDFVKCAYRDRQGALWFGTFNGLSRLDLRPDPEPAAPPISINGLRIAGVKQPLSEFGSGEITGLELSPAQNDLQIDFSSLGVGHAALLRYQYKLEGAGQDWNAATDQRTVNYPSLAPGDYRFLVRAVSPEGLVSTRPARLSFRILPPLWRRSWFLTLGALAVGLAIYSLYRYRLGRLLELERVRMRIATDLHDDIGSSLSQIAVLSEVVRRRLDTPDPAAVTPLRRIAHLSRESVDSMSDIVWAINPRNDRLSDLTHRMRHFANEILTASDIELRFNAPSDEQDMRIGPDTRRQVFLIFKEAINNIVRHSACSEVEIDFRSERACLVLRLRDNGRGFDPSSAGEGHGLMSLHQRARNLGAEFEVISSPGMGATVAIRIPHGH